MSNWLNIINPEREAALVAQLEDIIAQYTQVVIKGLSVVPMG